jgi:uncharacterized protein YbjT (DUF2867 family)
LIAVTGATGEVGGRVAQRLADRGTPQRLVVRDASRAPRLDGAEVRTIAGYGSFDDVRAALEGIDTLLLVPGEEALDRVEQHKTAVDAAVAAGVRRIVYFSFVNAAPDATFTLVRHHWATEQHIAAAGVEHTFLRMSMYMDFLPFMVGADGAIRGPADEGRAAFVLRDDLADVAAAVLVDPEPHDGATYDVTGPESITLGEAAETIARVTGKPIRFEDETLDEAWASRRQTGAPDWEIEGWISSYVGLASGELDVVSDTVERIAGHAPVALADYVREHPEALNVTGSA